MTDVASLRSLNNLYPGSTKDSVFLDVLRRFKLTKHVAELSKANGKRITEDRRLHRVVEQKPKPQNKTACESDDRYALGGDRMSLIVCDTSREGSDHDIQRIKQFCTQYGFSCYMTNCLSRVGLLEDLEKFRDGLDENVCCLTIFIMAHGELGHIKLRDGKIELRAIFEMFDNRQCSVLRGKPKLFVIQACRGVKKCAKYSYCDGTEVSNSPRDFLWPVESDFLLVYAVCPGKLALRYPDTGSPLFEEMNVVFSRSADMSMSMFDLFTMVNSRLVMRTERDGFETDRQRLLSLEEIKVSRKKEPKPSMGGSLHIVDTFTKRWCL